MNKDELKKWAERFDMTEDEFWTMIVEDGYMGSFDLWVETENFHEAYKWARKMQLDIGRDKNIVAGVEQDKEKRVSSGSVGGNKSAAKKRLLASLYRAKADELRATAEETRFNPYKDSNEAAKYLASDFIEAANKIRRDNDLENTTFSPKTIVRHFGGK